MAVRVVALDLMDTVVHDPFREALEAATGRPAEEALRHREPRSWPRFERAELTEQQFFSTFQQVDFDVAAFHAARRDGYRWMPGMRALLDDLAGQAVRAAASNYPVWVEELAHGLLQGRFEHVVASHHLGVRKPDRSFYERFCARIRADPAGVLFIDDREENVEGALAAGLPAHLFTDADDLRVRLRHEGMDL